MPIYEITNMAKGLPVPMNWSILSLNGCWCSAGECVTTYRTLSEHSDDKVWRSVEEEEGVERERGREEMMKLTQHLLTFKLFG